MQIIALILLALGILCMSGAGVAQKAILNKKILTAGQAVMIQQCIAALSLFLIMLFWDQGNLVPKSDLFWIAICITGGVNIFIQYANTRSKQIADISLVAPIQAVTPGLVTVTSIMIGEVPSTLGIIGILMISVGTFVHTRENAKTLREWLAPFTALALPKNFEILNIGEKQEALNRRDALRWAYGSACAGTIGLIFDGLAARNGNPGLAFGLVSTIIFCFFAFSNVRGSVRSEFWKVKKILTIAGPLVLFCGILYGLHAVLITTAMRYAPIAYIGSMKRFSIVVTVLMAYFFLGEMKAIRRIWPALVITIGAILLVLDPSIATIISKAQNAFGY